MRCFTKCSFEGGPLDGDEQLIEDEQDVVVLTGDPRAYEFPETLMGHPVVPLVGSYRRVIEGPGAGFRFIWVGDHELDRVLGFNKPRGGAT